ncbi:MAG: efflux transporter periplasmic adaptor subunit, partial [Alphaproteobacteria bacterium]|nr:efflux transporter periplasmic adaptor subunit [Alphaproteobacteria bacterium]
LFELPRDPKLRAGMFLRGQARLPATDQLAAPSAAVVFDAGQAFVFAIDEKNVARKAKVMVGDRDGDFVAIREGLQANARVAASGAAFLRDGELVRPVEPVAPTAPASAAAITAKGG